MANEVEKQVANSMVDDLIPGAKEKRESDALQAKLARAERSVYGSGYSHQGRFDDRYWERGGDSLDDLGGTSSYKKPATGGYKAPAVVPLTKARETQRIKNLLETGAYYKKDKVEITAVIMDKIVNELVGMVEETLDGANFTWKTGGSKLFRETFKLAMVETMEVWSKGWSKDMPIEITNDAADDEDMFDDWYKKMCDICQETYGVTPVDDFAWSMNGIRSVWFNGSTAEWMANHFGEREGLRKRSVHDHPLDPVLPGLEEPVTRVSTTPSGELESVKFDRFTGEIIEESKAPTVTLDD